MQGDNPEDKSASSLSSAEQAAPQPAKKRQLPQRRPYTRGSKVDLDKADEDHEIVDELISAKFSAQGLYTSTSVCAGGLRGHKPEACRRGR